MLTSQKPAMVGKVGFFVSTALGELLDVLATFLKSSNPLKSVQFSFIASVALVPLLGWLSCRL